jgi:hypothetical protein
MRPTLARPDALRCHDIFAIMRAKRIVMLLLVAATLGVAAFGYLASNAVTVERVDDSDAARRFLAARVAFGSAPPMLEIAPSGRVVRRPSPPREGAGHVERFRILVYQVQQRRLVEADVPFWFVALKGPALQYAVRDTGVDLDRLGVTAADLRRHGPGPILDETRPNGDRVLVWIE